MEQAFDIVCLEFTNAVGLDEWLLFLLYSVVVSTFFGLCAQHIYEFFVCRPTIESLVLRRARVPAHESHAPRVAQLSPWALVADSLFASPIILAKHTLNAR